MSTVYPRPLVATTTALNVVAGILLLGLMLLTVADVISRNVRGISILGVVDISTLLLVGIAFLGLGSAEITGKNVSVTLVEKPLGLRAKTALSIGRLVALAVITVVLVFGLVESAYSAFDRAETTNAILLLPTWQTKVVLFIAFAVFLIAAVLREVQELRLLHSGIDPADHKDLLTEEAA